MRWHPATGVGVIALANGTYAPMTALTALVLDALLPRSSAYHVALAPAATRGAPARAGAPWPETLAAAEAVNRLLLAWDDGTADALFTENVALDSPYPERRHAIGRIRERIGDFTADGAGAGSSQEQQRARPSPTPRRTAAGGSPAPAAPSRRRSSSTPSDRPASSPSPSPSRRPGTRSSPPPLTPSSSG